MTAWPDDPCDPWTKRPIPWWRFRQRMALDQNIARQERFAAERRAEQRIESDARLSELITKINSENMSLRRALDEARARIDNHDKATDAWFRRLEDRHERQMTGVRARNLQLKKQLAAYRDECKELRAKIRRDET